MNDKMKGAKRSKKRAVRIIVIAAIIFFIASIVSVAYICDNREIVEKPCVDGDGDVDLEGLVMFMIFCVIVPWWIANNISFVESD